MNQPILITGPARSGKSDWAEQLAAQSGQAVVYVATSRATESDPEWQQRIAQHRARRPRHWQLWEVPEALPEAIAQATPTQCLVIDSLGTWLANHIDLDEAQWQHRHEALLEALQRAACQAIVVAEETGWGVVPAYPMGRSFRDRLGSLTRAVGAIAQITYLVTGGFALPLSQLGVPVRGLSPPSALPLR